MVLTTNKYEIVCLSGSKVLRHYVNHGSAGNFNERFGKRIPPLVKVPGLADNRDNYAHYRLRCTTASSSRRSPKYSTCSTRVTGQTASPAPRAAWIPGG